MGRVRKRGKHKREEWCIIIPGFCMSTASRVGTGNLAGVAIAISAGGPGAVF